MKTLRFSSLRGCLFLVAVVLALTSQAEAGRARSRSGTFSGTRGGGSYQRDTDREPEKMNRDTTWQNQNGGQGSRSVTGTNDPASGTASRNANTTYANGKSSSSQSTVTRNGDGTASVQSTATGSNGKTATVDSTLSKSTNGVEKTGSYETSGGKTGTIAGNSSVENGTLNRSNTLTTSGGQSVQKDVSTVKTDSGAARTVTTTGPEGNSNTRNQTVTVDKSTGQP